jgi:tetratricopeptide (TPR) repeat protein
MKQYDLALRDYDTAIRTDPLFANAFILRGYTFNILKQWNEAIQDFTEAMRLAPSDVRSYNNRGFSMLALKQYDIALKDLSKAIELDTSKKYENAYCHRAFLYSQIGNVEEVVI